MVFDYEKFSEMVNGQEKGYLSKAPYPFAIFDGLFSEATIDMVNKEIETQGFRKDERSISNIEIKIRSDFEDNESVPTSCRQIFDVLNGGKFLNLVSQLTSIEGLISDPYFDGGGINMIENGGTLAVHIDGTTQHRMQVCRRINAILFVNDYWDPNWNGYHEQWDYKDKSLTPFDLNQKWQCVRKILPKRNRLLIFTTNDFSWHGHAGVLNVPEGVLRKSLISYYYTVSRPETDLCFDNPHRALFIDNSITLNSSAFDETEVIL